MSSSPQVSVIIPTRNRWARLQGALATVAEQEGIAVEAVVVDDGSTDGTFERLAGREGIRSVRHEGSQGGAAARNAGFAAAEGEWIAFLDDDDLWAPSKLRAQLDAMERDGSRWAYCSALVVNDAGRILLRNEAPLPADVALQSAQRNPIPAGSSNAIVHRDLLSRAGGFDLALSHSTDWHLWARLAAIGTPAAVYQMLVAYVVHDEGRHVTQIHAARREFSLLSAKLEAVTGRPLDGCVFESWLAGGHRSAGRHWRAAGVHARAAARWRSWRHLRSATGQVACATHLRREPSTDYGPAPKWAQPRNHRPGRAPEGCLPVSGAGPLAPAMASMLPQAP